MRRALLTLLAVLLLAPAAHAQAPAGGFTSPGVEFVSNFARHWDSSGAKLKDGFFYITTERDLVIYDVKDAEHPVQVGTFTFPDAGTPIFTEEDPDTNGRILLVWNAKGLMVIDVSDKTKPALLSSLADTSDQHTVSCILDCTWAYGSEGAIVDLRDPAKPRLSKQTWDRGADSFHDVSEVSPGLVLTSTEPMYLLDARSDPENPTVLAEARAPGFTHANLWPHGGTDDFALVGGESVGPNCSEEASATFQTWDTRGWQSSRTFKLVDQFAMSTGLPPQGASPETTYCVHWFTTHPTYANGGLVAIAWYEHGVRFLKVSGEGNISEVGWYVPVGGQSSGAYWINDRVVYVADYLRGLDILRFTGEVPQGRGTPPAPGSKTGSSGPSETAAPSGPSGPASQQRARSGKAFDQLVRLPSARRCVRSVKVSVRSRDVKSVELRRNGRRVAGRTVRAPRGKRFSVQVLVRTRDGAKVAGQRAYRGCR
jgi:hypothetical protein